jgi:actin-related protein 2
MPRKYGFCAGTFTLSLMRSWQNFPEFQYPSIVGRPILRSEEQAGDIIVKDIMCGDEAAAARSMLQISYPVLFLHSSTILSH